MHWQPTAALARVTVLPAALALLAVLVRRVDLLVLAAPLALAALALTRRPSGEARAQVDLTDAAVPEGAPLALTVRVAGGPGAQTGAVAVATPGWVQPAGGGTVDRVERPDAAGGLSVTVDLLAQRWGHAAVGPVLVTLSACGGLLRAGPAELPARRVRVLPLSAPYTGAALVPRARGGIGLHRSPHRGEGTELAGVRPFVPGDRIRRINWRTSLRAGELQVTATTTERDADVVLLADARFDAGTSEGIGGRASGVDVTVRATAALAAFYLQLGDRVGLVTYAASGRVLPARAGRGQLDRLQSALLDTSAPRTGGVEPRMPVPAGLDPRALVLVVSPLVGRHVGETAAALSRAGHPVVVVDTLPADALPGPADDGPWTGPVTRLWLLERDTRVRQLQSLGVPVVSWTGRGTLDAVLVELTRAAARSGGRGVRR
ncbi:DUF58 domain-containing protein [Modestobacter sp. SYSU DS0290]